MLHGGGSVATQLPRGRHVCGSAVWLTARTLLAAAALGGGAPVLPLLAGRRCHSASHHAALPLSVPILSLPMAGAGCLLPSTSQVQGEGKPCPSGSSLALTHFSIPRYQIGARTVTL